jgi:hypothetical protein
MNTGMHACNLAWKLALVSRGICAPEPLLSSYSTERSAIAKLVLEATGKATAVAVMKRAASSSLFVITSFASFWFRTDQTHDGKSPFGGPNAIGIILSGSGTDGSKGIQASKQAGGLTFAQDESSALFDGMPNSAIRMGCVDFILSPGDIALEL